MSLLVRLKTAYDNNQVSIGRLDETKLISIIANPNGKEVDVVLKQYKALPNLVTGEAIPEFKTVDTLNVSELTKWKFKDQEEIDELTSKLAKLEEVKPLYDPIINLVNNILGN